MSGVVSQSVLDQQQTKRLAIYRAAVQHGFYNEADNTVSFRGFHIVHDEHQFNVMLGGQKLMQFVDQFVAKCWITARLDNCTLKEASIKLRQQERIQHA